MSKTFVWCAIVWALGAGAVHAQGALVLGAGDDAPAPGGSGVAAGAGILTGRPTVSIPRTTTPPSIDGRLDDAAWRTAARITSFTQQRPLEGVPATEQTEVYVAYDSRNLYFGIYAHYADPRIIRANRVDRDQTGRDDTVSLYFDPFVDQQRAYVFSVNGYGVQGDAIVSGTGGGGQGGNQGGGGNRGGGPGGQPGGGGGGGGGNRGGGPQGGQNDGDPSWDALFSSSGQLVEDGWIAEIAIPFKSLRYPSRSGSDVHRWGFQIQRDIESKNESSVWAPVSRDIAGFLTQMGVAEGLEGLSTSRNLELLPTFTTVRSGALDTTSGSFNSDVQPEGGLNVKYGITSNLTSDFTFNPDFSQIESDRQQIEINQRFPLFYAELRPFFLEGQEIFQTQGPVAFVHTRTIVDPRYGAKLSGKLGNTTIGLIYADDEAPGKADDPADPAFGRSAQVFIGRVRYDLYSESSIGVLVTDREFLDRHSRVGGVDAQFRMGRTHRLNLRAMQSDYRGADGVRLSGPMLDFGLRKEGRNLSYSIFHYQIDPDFRTDLGFVQRTDVRRVNTQAQYRWWPESWIISWAPRATFSRNYDFAGVLQDQETNLATEFQFARNIFARVGMNRDMERFGGTDFWKTRISFGASVNTSRRISIGGFYNGGDQVRYLTENPYLGRGGTGTLFLTVRPFSRLQSQVDLNTSRLRDPRNGTQVFDVKIARVQTTYQFTDRMLARNITEYNTLDKTLGLNLLMTYRVNSGTVFYVGYDDRLRQGNTINAVLFPDPRFHRTNRAVFTKLQYLFRY